MNLISFNQFEVNLLLTHSEFELLKGYVEFAAEHDHMMTFTHPQLLAAFREIPAKVQFAPSRRLPRLIKPKPNPIPLPSPTPHRDPKSLIVMHVRQYRPAFFEGFENEEHDIQSLKKFPNLPFIKRLLDSGTVTSWRTRVYTPDHVIVSGVTPEGKSFVVCFVTGPGREVFLDLT